MLDSADDILPAALSYLGIDPNSTKQADLEKAADLVSKIRPYVRKFHSSEYLGALASGEICFVVGWSGDIMQARSRAAEAKNGIEIGYTIPKEGAQMFFDNLAIPADAKNVAEAYRADQLSLPAGGRGQEFRFPVLRQRQSGEPEAGRSENPQRQEHLSGRGDPEKAVRHQRARSRHPAHHQPALDQGEDGEVTRRCDCVRSRLSARISATTAPIDQRAADQRLYCRDLLKADPHPEDHERRLQRRDQRGFS